MEREYVEVFYDEFSVENAQMSVGMMAVLGARGIRFKSTWAFGFDAKFYGNKVGMRIGEKFIEVEKIRGWDDIKDMIAQEKGLAKVASAV